MKKNENIELQNLMLEANRAYCEAHAKEQRFYEKLQKYIPEFEDQIPERFSEFIMYSDHWDKCIEWLNEYTQKKVQK